MLTKADQLLGTISRRREKVRMMIIIVMSCHGDDDARRSPA